MCSVWHLYNIPLCGRALIYWKSPLFDKQSCGFQTFAITSEWPCAYIISHMCKETCGRHSHKWGCWSTRTASVMCNLTTTVCHLDFRTFSLKWFFCCCWKIFPAISHFLLNWGCQLQVQVVLGWRMDSSTGTDVDSAAGAVGPRHSHLLIFLGTSCFYRHQSSTTIFSSPFLAHWPIAELLGESEDHLALPELVGWWSRGMTQWVGDTNNAGDTKREHKLQLLFRNHRL